MWIGYYIIMCIKMDMLAPRGWLGEIKLYSASVNKTVDP